MEEKGWGSGQTIRVHTISSPLTTLRVFDYYDVSVVVVSKLNLNSRALIMAAAVVDTVKPRPTTHAEV